MADRQVTVRISAQDSFSTVLEKYNREMGQAEQATKKADTANRQAESSFSAIKGAITGAIGAMALNQIIQYGEQMNALGTEVRANRAIFDQLTESMGGQDRAIRSLRESTGGVVDDLTLMGAANQLLRLNIVGNTEDLSKLVGQIQRLKDPTESTTDAIRNFALMLSNESLLRLDSFGISSAAVKKSMDELGLSFREAVQIEMDKQIERLGDAANVAETEFGKLQTRIENIIQLLSTGVAGGVEGVSGGINDFIDTTEGLVDFGTRWRAAEQELFGMGTLGLGNILPGLAYTQEQQRQAAQYVMDMDKRTEAVRQFVEGIRDWGEVARAAQAEIDAATARAPYESALNFLQGDLAYLNQETGGGNFRFLTRDNADLIQSVFASMKAKAQEIKDSMGDLLTDDDLALLDRYVEQAKRLADAANDAAKAFENLSLADILGTSSGGILGEITDDLLAAGQAAGWSKEKLEEYKDALDLVSGRQTPMSQAYQSDLIPALMALPPDQAAQAAQYFEQSMRLAAENNIPFSNLVDFGLSTFAGLFGGGTRSFTVEGGDWIDKVLRENPWLTREQLMSVAGTGGGRYIRAGTFQVPTSQLLGDFNPESFMQSIMGTLNATVGEQGSFGLGGLGTAMQDAEDSASQIDIYMTNIGDSVSTFSGNLEAAFGKTYTLNLDVVANLPDWLKAAIRDGTSLVDLVGDAIRINGGVTPGATSSTPRAGRFQATE